MERAGRQPELGRTSAKAAVGCWGLGSTTSSVPALAPPSDKPSKALHQRRMSFGNWFSRGHDDSHQQQQEEENTLPDAEQLSEALFDLDLDEGGSGRRQKALDKAGPSALDPSPRACGAGYCAILTLYTVVSSLAGAL